MKRLTLLIAVVLCVTTCIFAKKEKVLLPMNEFVTELMGKMTVKEKIGQLNLLHLKTTEHEGRYWYIWQQRTISPIMLPKTSKR